ncbi:DinB family protein [Chitinophaga sp. Hz27]|uniref:DinB family protein n=1 Tax=Chitinophaga sp. Hz27 TaxID=3347169 RepID=UPI0035D7419B
MLQEILPPLFNKELLALAEEIKAYSSDELIWKVPEGVSNSGGNLCLHICGNIRHFIGAQLGNTGYIRDRDYEFSAKGLPRETLLADIQDTTNVIWTVIHGLTPEFLGTVYAENPLKDPGLTYGGFLTYIYGHLRYHLGQINYHRRLTH